jgi:DNA-damage-inducible protein D
MDQVGLVPAGNVRLILFKGKEIRQVFHNNEWLFSLVDIVEVLVGTGRHR